MFVAKAQWSAKVQVSAYQKSMKLPTLVVLLTLVVAHNNIFLLTVK